MASDPFDNVFNLEEQFYQEGYQQGVAEGAHAGKVEGRGLGLEKGYEKFFEAGRLYGRSLVWGSRLPQQAQQPEGQVAAQEPAQNAGQEKPAVEQQELPPLSSNPRLKKNVVILHALVEPETLSTENTDDAVNDFDDRLKRAQGKARIIEKTTGEQVPKPAVSAAEGQVSANRTSPSGN